ncbi:MAG: formylglycine-generating enzyme family protein [Actinomycetia bacterium]|nr:formylglycine-generating enzyme family protein [Actinomycetes bacterium]
MRRRALVAVTAAALALVAACSDSSDADHSVKVSEADGMKLLDVDGFAIDETEVTNAMYALCVADAKCEPPADTISLTRDAYYDVPEFADYPVIFVDWEMAKTYCEWAGRELPTEEQWEMAARGDDERAYPWGNDLPTPTLANSNDVVGDTTEVGSYPAGASPYGALDMAGNVWEWTSDFFDGKSTHVLRGGAWSLDDESVRADFRGTHPSEPNLGIGFRCALVNDDD